MAAQRKFENLVPEVQEIMAARPKIWQFGDWKINYSRKWFCENGFDESEFAVIDEKRVHLFRGSGLFFQVVIWPPAAHIFDAIEADLARRVSIIDSRELAFTEDCELARFVREIYSIDDINKWKVEKKIWLMRGFEQRIRVIWVELPRSGFRPKNSNPDVMISLTAEQLKKELRGHYRSRIANYEYDNLLHIGDNYSHNKHIERTCSRFLSHARAA